MSRKGTGSVVIFLSFMQASWASRHGPCVLAGVPELGHVLWPGTSGARASGEFRYGGVPLTGLRIRLVCFRRYEKLRISKEVSYDAWQVNLQMGKSLAYAMGNSASKSHKRFKDTIECELSARGGDRGRRVCRVFHEGRPGW